MNIGHESYVPWWQVVSILDYRRARAIHITREEAEEKGLLIDNTRGRPRRSLILTTGKHVIMSSVNPATLMVRLEVDRTKNHTQEKSL
jgi:regulator of extracellular matrix RemA (YlzA/DUF370 family)